MICLIEIYCTKAGNVYRTPGILTIVKKILEILVQEYIEEAQHVSQFAEHARQMHYPQFREKLLRIAAEEQEHAQWLREKILAVGGEIPQISFTPKTGKNSWESLLMDLEEEKRCCADLLERITRVALVNQGIAELLSRIYDDERIHREEIMDMLMRSDAYALWP